ncbi:hypothetical protein [Aquimarina sp. 2201CG5-10]|uniref:hypothetical protein n=1 Tax=Aquimarina callyspongiae TaxID=3098150 RepID=UPI002AB52BA3|nr:hypothetical protein [Aquimarina sp. 2201CG5-10]MDY8136986.1 hypothetical protein [Aquimarina sp. 2201CG5-10]
MIKSILNIEGIQLLSTKHRINITGGVGLSGPDGPQYFDCHCGGEEHHARVFYADSILGALNELRGICGNSGGSCSGLG